MLLMDINVLYVYLRFFTYELIVAAKSYAWKSGKITEISWHIWNESSTGFKTI